MRLMKRRWGAIVLGVAIALAGCGGGQADKVSGAGSVETEIGNTEIGVWTELVQSGQGQEGTAESPKPDKESESAERSEPDEKLEPTERPEPDKEPESAERSGPARDPEPTEDPSLSLTAEYELLYEGISLFNRATHYTCFKYRDVCADLYMRRLQDDAGEYIELSLWSDRQQIWSTADRNLTEESAGDFPPFWQENSPHITLDRELCYYVVSIDGTVYLMRYSVENRSGAVTMSYKVFGVDLLLGSEEPFDVGSISLYLVSDRAVDPEVSFPVKEMSVFADTVKGYMENGYLAVSSLGGKFVLGSSTDRDNPVSPCLYDIFPWIPEMAAQHGVVPEDYASPGQLLTALQNVLPTDASVTMPDLAADGNTFITGDYYSDESYLTVRMREDGSYEGTILIQQLLYTNFTGRFDGKILRITETDIDSDVLPYEMEISFREGRATVTVTAVAYEEGYVKVGDTFTLDRGEKPYILEVLKNAEYPAGE